MHPCKPWCFLRFQKLFYNSEEKIELAWMFHGCDQRTLEDNGIGERKYFYLTP